MPFFIKICKIFERKDSSSRFCFKSFQALTSSWLYPYNSLFNNMNKFNNKNINILMKADR